MAKPYSLNALVSVLITVHMRCPDSRAQHCGQNSEHPLMPAAALKHSRRLERQQMGKNRYMSTVSALMAPRLQAIAASPLRTALQIVRHWHQVGCRPIGQSYTTRVENQRSKQSCEGLGLCHWELWLPLPGTRRPSLAGFLSRRKRLAVQEW